MFKSFSLLSYPTHNAPQDFTIDGQSSFTNLLHRSVFEVKITYAGCAGLIPRKLGVRNSVQAIQ
jgi:hypothetical protein